MLWAFVVCKQVPAGILADHSIFFEIYLDIFFSAGS
jgi:hypothetical protein